MARKHTTEIPRTTGWGSNVRANFLAVDEAVQTTENEVQAARGNRSSLDDRLSQALDDDGNPLAGVAFSAQPFWTEEGAAVAYLSGASFSVAGDKAAIYFPGSNAGRALKATQTSNSYGYVESASFASGAGITTVLVTNLTLDAGLSKIEYGQDPRTTPTKEDLHEAGVKRFEATSSGAKLSGVNTVLDLNQGQMKLHEEAGGSDHTVSGPVAELTATQSFSFGEVGSCSSNGKFRLADADLSNAMPAMVMATGAIASNASGIFALPGCFVQDDSWSWTVGKKVYVSTTAGGLTQTAPSGSGDQVQAVGVATSATRIFFSPSMTVIPIPLVPSVLTITTAMISFTQGGWVYNGNEAAAKSYLVDGTTTTIAMYSNTTGSGSIEIDLGEAVEVTEMKLYDESSPANQHVFTLKYSDNGSSWTTTGVTFTSGDGAGWSTGDVSGNGSHRYWQFQKDSATTQSPWFDALEMSGYL